MRKKASILSLVVFTIFLGIVIFHPLSHGLHHGGDDGHDCPICLWMHNNTAIRGKAKYFMEIISPHSCRAVAHTLSFRTSLFVTVFA